MGFSTTQREKNWFLSCSNVLNLHFLDLLIPSTLVSSHVVVSARHQPSETCNRSNAKDKFEKKSDSQLHTEV